ncbi:MAG: hypothetical protein EP299_00105 [Acidobacteria bacterium]|nr:MAG: hypothetical protein EP299_00105 [Acidobacteriota bacterium]
MCEDKRQANDVASDRTSCCGPEMEQIMRAFFASARGEGENKTGPCADGMADMMEACCWPFARKNKPAGEDESAID